MLKWLRGFGTAMLITYGAAMTGLSCLAINDVNKLKEKLKENKEAEE